MPAGVELHREDRVAGLERGEVHAHVRLRAGVGLHVRVLGAEERLRALDRDRLDLVDDLAAAVVALARIALGVLVRRHRPDRLEDARPGEVLGRDQLDLTALPLELGGEQLRDLGIDLCEAGGAEVLEGFLRDGHAALLPREVSGDATRASGQHCESALDVAGALAENDGPLAREVDHGRGDARKLARRRRPRRRRSGSPAGSPRSSSGRGRRGRSRSSRRPRRRGRAPACRSPRGRGRARRSCPGRVPVSHR